MSLWYGGRILLVGYFSIHNGGCTMRIGVIFLVGYFFNALQRARVTLVGSFFNALQSLHVTLVWCLEESLVFLGPSIVGQG